MKTYFYKTLFVSLVVFILFRVLLGQLVNDIETKIENLGSKESIDMSKTKLRNEKKNAIEKDDYIKDDDAELIKKFIDKIKEEIK